MTTSEKDKNELNFLGLNWIEPWYQTIKPKQKTKQNKNKNKNKTIVICPSNIELLSQNALEFLFVIFVV